MRKWIGGYGSWWFIPILFIVVFAVVLFGQTAVETYAKQFAASGTVRVENCEHQFVLAKANLVRENGEKIPVEYCKRCGVIKVDSRWLGSH